MYVNNLMVTLCSTVERVKHRVTFPLPPPPNLLLPHFTGKKISEAGKKQRERKEHAGVDYFQPLCDTLQARIYEFLRGLRN